MISEIEKIELANSIRQELLSIIVKDEDFWGNVGWVNKYPKFPLPETIQRRKQRLLFPEQFPKTRKERRKLISEFVSKRS